MDDSVEKSRSHLGFSITSKDRNEGMGRDVKFRVETIMSFEYIVHLRYLTSFPRAII